MNIPEQYQPLHEYFKLINLNPILNPMNESEIDSLSFSKYRNNSGETMPLPASLQLLLSYDKDFMLYENQKLLQPLLDNLDSKTGIISSSNLNDYFRKWFPETTMYWNNVENAPAILPLYHRGDQLVFFYVSNLDNNEYPICRFDPTEFSLWISEINLIHYVFSNHYDMTEYENYLDLVAKKNENFMENEYVNV